MVNSPSSSCQKGSRLRRGTQRVSPNPVPNDEILPTQQDKSVADPGGTGYAVHKYAKTRQLGDKVRPHMPLRK